MLRRLDWYSTALCLIAGMIAIGFETNFAWSQDASEPIVTEAAPIDQSEPKKNDEKSDEKSDQAKPKTDEPTATNGDAEESKNEKPAEPNDDKQKKQDKAKPEKKPEPPQPKKLPKVGVLNSPVLPGQPWRVHDMFRPRPPVITPGELSTYEKPGTPPSDAIVLFDGTDLSQWCHISPEAPDQLLEAQWKVENGYFEVAPRTGSLQTIDSFGSCQFHIEWQAPAEVKGDSQGRGNSGVYFMGAFEVQILDSYNNRTYADGQAGAIYGQYPPMVNASRKPGEWQVYDILFEAPKFSLDGKLERPARVTVLHNGVFLHNAREYLGKSGGGGMPKYDPLTPAAPVRLQDHGNPVRFRNVWVRPISE